MIYPTRKTCDYSGTDSMLFDVTPDKIIPSIKYFHH